MILTGLENCLSYNFFSKSVRVTIPLILSLLSTMSIHPISCFIIKSAVSLMVASSGIVTTFLASTAVIQQAIDLDANFVITHEPTFYNHTDDVSELEDNAVYLTKRKLIDDHGIVIWRFHDYWHRHVPDGIMMGLIQTLGWESYISDKRKPVFTLPETTVDELINMLKQRLGCKTVRLVGDPNMVCTNIALMPGSPGPKWQIAFLDDGDVDVLLTGEVHEWETAEFARDAVLQGRQKALVLLGHANSEEAGMAYLVDWLQPKFPHVKIQHVPVGDAFLYIGVSKLYNPLKLLNATDFPSKEPHFISKCRC